MSAPLLSCRDVVVAFRGHRALDGVSLDIQEGEALGLLGESGSGKSTLTRVLVGLRRATSGSVSFRGDRMWPASASVRRRFAREVAVVFQDPGSSLDPRWHVGALIAEPLAIHAQLDTGQRSERVDELLDVVGLPADVRDRYPAELSGGQAQRVAIARALATRPSLLVADEPTSALDVSVKAQILNLLGDLRRRFGLAMLFVSHDVGAVRFAADRVVVMRDGAIVESGPTRAVTQTPHSPYTKTLIAAIPRLWKES